MPKQILMWTALPNGRPSSDFLALSVYLTPQFSTGAGSGPLSDFPDFTNWPATVGGAPGDPISFEVKFGNGSTQTARVVSASKLDPNRYPLVFDQAGVFVKDYQYTDISTLPSHTFNAAATREYVQSVYETFGLNNPTAPPVLTSSSTGQLRLPTASPLAGLFHTLTGAYRGSGPVQPALEYYNRPAPAFTDPLFEPPLEILDFHQAVAAMASYPILLRMFGFVFDLEIGNPVGFNSGVSTVQVIPTWTSQLPAGDTINLSPLTSCTLQGHQFITTPSPGSLDYANGMLDLADTTRFSVTELDVDGAAQRVNLVTSTLASIQQFQDEKGSAANGDQISVSLPALRSTGPTIVWTGFADQITSFASRQTSLWNTVQKHLANPAVKLPTFYANDVMRGQRVDVYTASDPSPQWLSLHQRQGNYSFGPGAGPGATAANLPLPAATSVDEGFLTPGASQAAGVSNPPPDLYIHEEIARWNGWSASAPRIGNALDPSDQVAPNPGNPAEAQADGDGNVNPQMSATFSVVPGTLPKLRFGNEYQFRARGVDLAGNSLPVTSTDSSTATPPFTYHRFQPVVAPTMAATFPFSPGQSTLVMAILSYNATNQGPVVPNGRWLFAPKVAELLVEEHGMLDGALGAPNPGEPPDGTQPTYAELVTLTAGSFASLAGGANPLMEVDSNTGSYYAAPDVTDLPLPWLCDPLSEGVGFVGLPGGPQPTYNFAVWEDGPWPNRQPLLLQLVDGLTAGTSYTPGTAKTAPVQTVTLPPGAVYDVQISSLLSSPDDMAIFQWIQALVPAAQQNLYRDLAILGLNWMLTPYVTLRMVHATQVPVSAPYFNTPVVTTRLYGQTTAQIYDLSFHVDAESTSSIDVQAVWTDPVDDPTNILNNPLTDTITTTAPAFKVTVPDPKPPLPTATPGFVTPAPEPFALSEKPGVTHDIGDTKHHYVTYWPTGTSRFAEFYRPQRPIAATVFTSVSEPVMITPTPLGLNAGATEITDAAGDVVDPSLYIVDEAAGTIQMQSAEYLNVDLYVDYEPIVTLQGPEQPLHILSSSRPDMPLIDRVMPAWEIAQSSKPVATHGSAFYARAGNWLRVWLDRPWYSTGDNELLGVVTMPHFQAVPEPPADPQSRLVTLVGMDPISVADASLYVTSSPTSMSGVTTVPSPIPGHAAYTVPPRIALAEDPTNQYQIWPYEVNYDEGSQQWYADVQINYPFGQEPAPGYMVRLGLVRFQPYSYAGAEVSRVSLATFSQPVADRAVSVVQSGPQALRVSVEGPAYQGFRPAAPQGENGPVVEDEQNNFAIQTYSQDGGGYPTSSTMVVEVQVQDTSFGLSGDLAWTAVGTPVALSPVFEGPIAVWTGTLTLPYAIGTGGSMRVRLSELDYYTGTGAPAVVDTMLRRPFIAHIPIQ